MHHSTELFFLSPVYLLRLYCRRVFLQVGQLYIGMLKLIICIHVVVWVSRLDLILGPLAQYIVIKNQTLF